MAMKLICPSGEAITLTATQVQRSGVLRVLEDELDAEVKVRCTPQALLYLKEFLQYPIPTRQKNTSLYRADHLGQLFLATDRDAVEVITRLWTQDRSHFFDLLNLSNFLDLACLQQMTTVQLAYALTHTPKESWLSLVSSK
jgi:hypothetical protein